MNNINRLRFAIIQPNIDLNLNFFNGFKFDSKSGSTYIINENNYNILYIGKKNKLYYFGVYNYDKNKIQFIITADEFSSLFIKGCKISVAPKWIKDFYHINFQYNIMKGINNTCILSDVLLNKL